MWRDECIFIKTEKTMDLARQDAKIFIYNILENLSLSILFKKQILL